MATIREKAPYQWAVQIRRKGWPNQSATFRTRKDAQAWARKIESDMDRGLFIDQSGAQHTTLADLIAIYLKEVTDKRPGEDSRIAERSRLERFLREEAALCSYAVSNLTPEHFEDYRDRRLAQPVSRGKKPAKSAKTIAPGTVKRELTLLKRVIDHRKRRLGLLINPVNTEDVKRPAVNDERDVRLTKDELKRLLSACEESRVGWLRPFVELAFETGARRGSLLRLRWCDVDLEGRAALLRGIKNSRNPGIVIDHPIGLSPRAVDLLTAWRAAKSEDEADREEDGEERVFPVSANALRLAFNRARKRAGVAHFRFHDTRHERTSNLFEAGWSLIQVMAQTGHKDPKSVKRYANLSKEHLADALAQLPQ
ncbi:tyrosine-type recombinase/integrase [Afifella pfennigii]|uniref:tyrosine-type recombinase/integrase n=1 Tax=Afifella pfennigii TaxID=209897 RepID=UPI00047BB026|nr:site-specific integrase [Afifella pfennigii]